MNILGKDFAESLMKTTDLWYMTLLELRPADVAPQEDRPEPLCAREPFHLIEINGIPGSTKS